MALQLSINWNSVPIPSQILLENNPLITGILAHAYALLFTDRDCRDLAVLTQRVAAWSQQPTQDVEKVLRAGLGISARSRMFESLEVSSPNVRSRTRPTSAATPKQDSQYKGYITQDWLSSLPEQYPLINTREQYTRALAWYTDKNKKLTQSGFLAWLDRCKPDEKLKALNVCQTCDGTQTILGDEDGIPTTQDCPDCTGDF